jgi:hypothetical protein
MAEPTLSKSGFFSWSRLGPIRSMTVSYHNYWCTESLNFEKTQNMPLWMNDVVGTFERNARMITYVLNEMLAILSARRSDFTAQWAWYALHRFTKVERTRANAVKFVIWGHPISNGFIANCESYVEGTWRERKWSIPIQRGQNIYIYIYKPAFSRNCLIVLSKA